jgi:hypothetical protein
MVIIHLVISQINVLTELSWLISPFTFSAVYYEISSHILVSGIMDLLLTEQAEGSIPSVTLQQSTVSESNQTHTYTNN